MENPERSKKHEDARTALTTELQSVFDDLVADYQFFGRKHYDTPFVSYLILADLVRQGWRCVASPEQSQLESPPR
jgi:hypothetical protein